MHWSTGNLSNLINSYSALLSSRVSDIVRISTASPVVCWDVGLPPTTLFNAGHLYPEVTIIGWPQASRNGSNILSTNDSRFLIINGPGVLSIPLFFAVVDFVNSFIVKYFYIN